MHLYADPEHPIDQGTIDDRTSADNGDADLDGGPDRRVAVGPRGINKSDAVELGDAIDRDDADTSVILAGPDRNMQCSDSIRYVQSPNTEDTYKLQLGLELHLQLPQGW